MKQAAFSSRIPTGLRVPKSSRAYQGTEGDGCGAKRDRLAGQIVKNANDQQSELKSDSSNIADRTWNQVWNKEYVYPDEDWIQNETPPPLVPSDNYQFPVKQISRMKTKICLIGNR
ncbi:uncharacterized protein LOC129775983 isoform X2 [Toxorhynchites rutilus septentrionalis]|uniref:uncharacterized protein LOC129775983 isoform X2 n=1 Tax=Toxorhynchites rutilus septentrionalis TaxID=329112 RepID=UPI00247ACF18|nr:uncharacterized protein LOC129775983 isoform X2 [Toxorhynchites rutilus septentrionalis]